MIDEDLGTYALVSEYLAYPSIYVNTGDLPKYYALPPSERERFDRHCSKNLLGHRAAVTTFKLRLANDVWLLDHDLSEAGQGKVKIDIGGNVPDTGSAGAVSHKLQLLGLAIAASSLGVAITVGIRHWYGV
nr:hypothetical protein [uncultured Massilia sp.]